MEAVLYLEYDWICYGRDQVKGYLVHVSDTGAINGELEEWFDDAVAAGLSVTHLLTRVPKDVDVKVTVSTSENPNACEAVLFHGPGHQSKTRCRIEGPHEVHETIYGSDRTQATWQGDEAMTGFFDEPPEVED